MARSCSMANLAACWRSVAEGIRVAEEAETDAEEEAAAAEGLDGALIR